MVLKACSFKSSDFYERGILFFEDNITKSVLKKIKFYLKDYDFLHQKTIEIIRSRHYFLKQNIQN